MLPRSESSLQLLLHPCLAFSLHHPASRTSLLLSTPSISHLSKNPIISGSASREMFLKTIRNKERGILNMMTSDEDRQGDEMEIRALWLDEGP